MIGALHVDECYDKRNTDARGITTTVIDRERNASHGLPMLTKRELLGQIEDAAKSRAEIARVLGVAPARITEMYSGARDLSFDEARKLMRHYHVPLIDEADLTGAQDALAQEMGLSFVPEVDIGYSMGGGSVIDMYEQRGVVPFKSDWLRGLYQGSVEDLVVARGEGDSMQPTLLDGDLVLIDTSQKSIRSQDRIWAVAWGDLGMIKRVRREPGGVYSLLSDNPAVTAISAADGEMFVIGRVVWIGRRM